MIFAVQTEERALTVFPNESEAVAYCEGLDVEAGVWLFWASDGSPLEAEFTVPNTRGVFVVGNGNYHLAPAATDHHANLGEALDEILRLEPNHFFRSLEDIRIHLG